MLAEATAGKSFLVAPDDNGAALKNAAAAAVANKIGNEYVVGSIGDGSTGPTRIEAFGYKGLKLTVINPG